MPLGACVHGCVTMERVQAMAVEGVAGLLWPRAGNNAVEMQTTATYDPVTQEFIIHTPTTLAQKFWITK